MRLPLIVSLLLAPVLGPRAVRAQRADSIGVTSVGNLVLLERRSVTRRDGIVTATVRARFLKPVKAPGGDLRSSRTIAMFDCAKRLVAVKENWYYWDAAGRKVANHKVVGRPGFSSPIGGSLPDVAMRHLCAGGGARLSDPPGNPSPLNTHVRDRGGLEGRRPLDSGVGIAH